MMRKKLDPIWRLTVALALVFALVAVMAAPALADPGVEGTIVLDADYYKTDVTVTVTVEDADENVAHTAVDEKSTTTPNDMEKTFALLHTPIDVEAVTEVDDLAGMAYTASSVDTNSVTLGSAPPATVTLKAETAIDTGISLGTQPAHPTALIFTTTDAGTPTAPGAGNAVIVYVSGYDESGVHRTDSGSIVDTETTWTSSVVFASVDPGGIDLTTSGTPACGHFTVTADNAVYVDYGYSDTDTVTVTAVSTDDPTGISVDLDESGGVNTGVFTGTFTLVDTASDDATDKLLATECNTITVSYEDAEPAGTRTATAEVDNTPPTITVVSPADLSATNDNTPTISAELEDVKSGIDEGSIFMKLQKDTTPPTTDVTHTYAAGVVSFTPDTGLEYETLSDGKWYASVDVSDVAGNAATTEVWSFDVDTVVPGAISDLSATAKPRRIELAWSEPNDPGPSSGIDHYNIYRGTAEGVSTDTPIADSTTNSYSDTTGEEGVTYYYVVTAVDAAGNEGPASNEPSATFTEEYPTVTYSITLTSGWNLISIPAIPENTTITSVLASVDGSYSIVWSYWDGRWYSYDPAAYSWANTLRTIEDGKGYWIEMTALDSLEGAGYEVLIGPSVPPTYDLVAGWNLIGFKPIDSDTDGVMDGETMTASEYLASITVSWSGLCYYDPADVQLKELPGGSSMEAGKGYWIYMPAAGTIVAPAAH